MALLEEAGWTDADGDGVRECNGCPYAEEGRALKLKIQTTSGNALREQAEQVIMEMLAEIGVELYIENVPSSELFGSYSSGAFRKHGQFDILMYTTSYGIDPQSQMYGYYGSDNIPCDDNSGTGLQLLALDRRRVGRADGDRRLQPRPRGAHRRPTRRRSERIAEGRPAHLPLRPRGHRPAPRGLYGLRDEHLGDGDLERRRVVAGQSSHAILTEPVGGRSIDRPPRFHTSAL